MPSSAEDDGEIEQLDSANVVWSDEETVASFGIPVRLLTNGWIHTPETGCYYPPSEVVEIEPQTEEDDE